MNGGVKNEEIILKGVHCPYCNKEDAVLISRSIEKKVSLQLPAYGLRYILCLMFAPFYALIYGYKLFEAKKTVETMTFAFCPHCGNSYEISPKEGTITPVKEEKFRRVREGKLIGGVCSGISNYTGVSLKWVRLMAVLYCLLGIGLIAYVLTVLFIPYKEESR